MSKSTSLRRGSQSVVGFGLSMIVLAVLSFLSIPALISASGGAAWGAIATGQSIGVVAAAAITYSWGLTGPAAVARATPAELHSEYSESLRVRAVLAVMCLPVAVGVSALLGSASPYLAMLGCLSTAVLGLRGNWIFVGKGRPYLLLWLETLPRALGISVGILLMISAHMDAAAGLVAQTIGSLFSTLCVTMWVRQQSSASTRRLTKPRTVRESLIRNRHGVFATVASASYSAAPMILVGLFSPSSLPAFALLYKLLSQVSTAISPLLDVLQGWVPRAEAQEVRRRAVQAFTMTALVGAVGVIAFSIAGPLLVELLGAGTVDAPYWATLMTGVAIASGLTSYVTGRAGLVPLGLVGYLTTNTLYGAAVGIVSISLLAHFFGTTGAVTGLALGTVVQSVLNLARIGRQQAVKGP